MKQENRSAAEEERLRNRHRNLLLLGVLALSLSHVLLYLGTRTLEKELDALIVRPFRAE